MVAAAPVCAEAFHEAEVAVSGGERHAKKGRVSVDGSDESKVQQLLHEATHQMR